MAALHEIPLRSLDGGPLDLARFAGRALLIVNVASKCGLTPQYEGLQQLHDRYRDRGFSVLGVPCNQFAGQEPGSAEEVLAFCASSYQVTFPLSEKLEVNGRRRHSLYRELTAVADGSGRAGDVEWNFEKFLISPAGDVVARLRPRTEPLADELVAALEQILPVPGEAVWTPRAAGELAGGERIRLADGTEMTATRIEQNFFDRENLVCLIEDSDVRWLARPLEADVEVEVRSRGAAAPRSGS